MLEDVSIIIPLAPQETAHNVLLNSLKNTSAEIICISKNSRAKSMNAGAEQTNRNFLWFLHADSQVSENNIHKLEKALQDKPNALHYFNLAFDDGNIMKLNAWGANIRSFIFGVPYGDQGFCISKENFTKIGKYSEDLELAEDLMFVWHARHAGIKLNRISSKLVTSSRKYKAHGWLKLTVKYQYIWIKLSIPKAWKLISGKT